MDERQPAYVALLLELPRDARGALLALRVGEETDERVGEPSRRIDLQQLAFDPGLAATM
jgi:hypothetical protein